MWVTIRAADGSAATAGHVRFEGQDLQGGQARHALVEYSVFESLGQWFHVPRSYWCKLAGFEWQL